MEHIAISVFVIGLLCFCVAKRATNDDALLRLAAVGLACIMLASGMAVVLLSTPRDPAYDLNERLYPPASTDQLTRDRCDALLRMFATSYGDTLNVALACGLPMDTVVIRHEGRQAGALDTGSRRR